MSQTRRDFIKYVVAGSIASGLPDRQSPREEPGGASASPLVEGEHFGVCHRFATALVFQTRRHQESRRRHHRRRRRWPFRRPIS